MNHHASRLLPAAAATVLAAATPASAQQAPPPARGDGDVVVTGHALDAGTSSVAGKLPLAILETPQSVQIVSAELIRDQGITGFDEVLRNVAGVAPASSPAEFNGEYRVRGFTTGPLRDGEPNTFGFGNGGSRDLFVNVERIEVLKGPAGVTFGGQQDGSLGGVINIVSKKPLAARRVEASLTVDRFGYASPSLDLTGPLDASGKLLFRLAAQYIHAGSFIGHVHGGSFGVYPSLLIGAGGRDTLLIQAEYSQKTQTRYFGLPAFGTVTGLDRLRLPLTRFTSEPGLAARPNTDAVLTATWDHRFGDAWSGHVVLRGFSQLQRYQGAFGQAAEVGGAGVGVEPDGRTLDRQYIAYRETDRDAVVDAYLTGRFETLGIAHRLVIGGSEDRYRGHTTVLLGAIAPIDLIAPVYGARPTGVAPTPDYRQRSDYYGLYAEDLVELAPRLKLSLGGRYSSLADRITNDDVVSEDRTVQAFVPRVGATVEVARGAVLFAGWARGLEPSFGTFAPGYDPKPVTSRQVEGGVKLDLGGRLSATIAVFDIVRRNGSVPDPANPVFSIQAGELRSSGVEADMGWTGPGGVSLTASYGYTDARVTRDEVLPVGDRVQNVPPHAGRLFATWAPPTGPLKGWKVGGGVYAASLREGTLPNSYRLPGFATLDALVARSFGACEVQLNLKNLADKRYFESTGSYAEGLFPGQPFTAQLTLRVVR